MGSLGQTMLTSIKRMADERVSEAVARKRIGVFARARVQELIASGEVSDSYTRTVDGVPGALEETVKLDGGRIEYAFARGRSGEALRSAARFMLQYAQSHSPNSGGPYSQSWFLSVNGLPWTRPIDDIPDGAKVMLTNFAPFSRRLEEQGRVLGRGRRAAHANPERMVTERTRQAVLQKFPTLVVQRTYVAIPGAPGGSAGGWEVPYHLRTGPGRGSEILYPTVVIAGG